MCVFCDYVSISLLLYCHVHREQVECGLCSLCLPARAHANQWSTYATQIQVYWGRWGQILFVAVNTIKKFIRKNSQSTIYYYFFVCLFLFCILLTEFSSCSSTESSSSLSCKVFIKYLNIYFSTPLRLLGVI